ncbi:biotin/lipoyl-binding protein, partial [Salmonella enterica subsp. enterica serovar Typhimurium]|nr:biotin/lipoyl-binding protein [Salmonella enterica subsp. enterica serovar Typhimurium]
MITVNKKWIRLIGIVGCTVWMASCKQAPDAGVKSSYAVMQIEPTDKELSSSYSATIRGRQDIDIYPQVSGTIEKLCVTEGQKVRRGQLLFIIDQVPYRAALKTATANVEAARAATSTAEL